MRQPFLTFAKEAICHHILQGEHKHFSIMHALINNVNSLSTATSRLNNPLSFTVDLLPVVPFMKLRYVIIAGMSVLSTSGTLRLKGLFPNKTNRVSIYYNGCLISISYYVDGFSHIPAYSLLQPISCYLYTPQPMMTSSILFK